MELDLKNVVGNVHFCMIEIVSFPDAVTHGIDTFNECNETNGKKCEKNRNSNDTRLNM